MLHFCAKDRTFTKLKGVGWFIHLHPSLSSKILQKIQKRSIFEFKKMITKDARFQIASQLLWYGIIVVIVFKNIIN